MSIQDDIFDLDDIISGNRERYALDNIIIYMSNLETEVRQLRADKKALIKSIAMLDEE